MKKILLPLLLTAVLTCVLYAKSGKDDVATDRIDFTLGAGEVTQISGATSTGAVAATAQPGAKQVSKAAGILGALTAAPALKQAPAVPLVASPSAMGFTFDLMSIARSTIDPVNIDLSFSLVFGDFGNFGTEAIYYLQFLSAGDYFGQSLGLDLAFDIFPLGDSPSGLYFGPIIGGRLYMLDSNFVPESESMIGAIVTGANGGYRFNFGGFIMDIGFVYGAVFEIDDSGREPIQDFQFKFSIGGFGDVVTKEQVKASKEKAGNKESNKEGEK